MSKERLKDPGLSLETMIHTMTNGHPGSIVLLVDIIKKGGQIDPDDAFGGLGTILSMDMNGIHDHKPYYLFSDVCKKDLIKTIGMVRACQLGLISEKVLLHAIDNRGEGLDVEATMIKVKETLPNFGNPSQQNMNNILAALQKIITEDANTPVNPKDVDDLKNAMEPNFQNSAIGDEIEKSIKGTFLDPSTYEREVEITVERTSVNNKISDSPDE